MLERLAAVGVSQRALSTMTGDSYRNVQNWFGGTTMPADFVVRFIEAVPTSGEWLLTGKGAPDPLAPSAATKAWGVVSELARAAQGPPDEFEMLLDQWEMLRQFFFDLPSEGEPGGGET